MQTVDVDVFLTKRGDSSFRLQTTSLTTKICYHINTTAVLSMQFYILSIENRLTGEI